MELSKSKLAAGVAVIALASLAIGRYTLPAKVVTKTETKVEIKEVVKYKEKSTKSENKDKEIIIITTKMPDGTVVTEKRIVDRGTVTIDRSKEGEKTTDITKESKSSTETTYAKNDWHLSALASPSGDGKVNNNAISYGLMVQRRIIGPFYLGGFGLTNKTVGASLGVTF